MKKNYSVSQFDLGIRLSQNNVNEILATHFGNKFVEYRNIWDRAGRGEISPAFPVDINVEFVDECNQRCTFCARNEKLHPDFGHTLNTGTKLSDHFVDKLVDEAGAHGLYAITLGSGEPLLFRNIFSVVKRLHNVGVIDSRLITNGLLLHKYTDQIFDSGLVHLFTSIGAFSEETYNRDRGYGYQKVVDNMISFLEEKKRRDSILPITRVSYVKTKDNESELEQFVDFWIDKVDLIDVQTHQNFNKNPSEYKDTTDIPKKRLWNCNEPLRRMSLWANGDLTPCCNFPGRRLIVGNYSKQSIREVWDSDDMSQFRRNLIDNPELICVQCQEG